jgi:uracil DNA glycosylase superfamily protein
MKNIFENKKYIVKDIINKKTEIKFVFILESPHIDELKWGHPIAGRSGKSMSKFLFKSDESRALGGIIKESDNLNLGIMNVCQIPMQGTAYEEKDLKNHKETISDLEKIRNSPKKKSILHKTIVENFNQRIKKLKKKNKKVILIPCGSFANATCKELHLNFIEGIPHPSFGWWGKKEKEIKKKFAKIGLTNYIKTQVI